MSLRFIPEPRPGGGTKMGHHYLKTFEDCPQLWFNQFLRPIVRDGILYHGISTRKTALPLLAGGLFHEMIAAWHLSGCRDGEDTGVRDIEYAIDVGQKHWNRTLAQYESPEKAEEDYTKTTALMREYHDQVGPNGLAPDYPDIKVAFDGEGEPLVERAFELSMGYPKDDPYIYTCRVDLIMERYGFNQVMEHKTSHVSFVKQKLRSIDQDAQFTGENAVLVDTCPEDAVNGVLVNIVAKGRAAKPTVRTPPLISRETTTRTPAQMEAWRKSTITTLMEIDDRVGGFAHDLSRGINMEAAAEWHFPMRGLRTGHCWSFNRLCGFAGLCERGNIERELEGFRPRSVEETKQHREHMG